MSDGSKRSLRQKDGITGECYHEIHQSRSYTWALVSRDASLLSPFLTWISVDGDRSEPKSVQKVWMQLWARAATINVYQISPISNEFIEIAMDNVMPNISFYISALDGIYYYKLALSAEQNDLISSIPEGQRTFLKPHAILKPQTFPLKIFLAIFFATCFITRFRFFAHFENINNFYDIY